MGSLKIGDNISVTIEHYLSDIIQVSFKYDEKIFQGVLLDSTKRQLPCGVYEENILSATKNLDNLYSVMQRHTYQDSNSLKTLPLKTAYLKSGARKKKNAPMTVRLRPRQVLCSKCSSICSENSENVSSSKIQKALPENESKPVELGNNDISSCTHSLVPKIVKLKPSDIQSLTNVGVKSLPSESNTSHSLPQSTELTSGYKRNCRLKPIYISKKTKIRIPKVSTSLNLENQETAKPCAIRTRSRGSVDDIALEISKHKEPLANKAQYSNQQPYEPLLVREEKHIVPSNPVENKSSEICMNKEDKKDNGNHDSLKIILPLPPKDCNVVDLESKQGLKGDKMNLRKKRSVGLMEDLWDESVFDENKKIKPENSEDENVDNANEENMLDPAKQKTNPVPVLKISYGAGKARVLKIHPKVTETNSTNVNLSEESPMKFKNTLTKAAKKALKRARKEALRKSLIKIPLNFSQKIKIEGKPLTIGGASPVRRLVSNSGTIGSSSPGRFSGASPGRIGNASPARFGNTSPGRFGGTSPGRFGNVSPARFGAASPGRLNIYSSSLINGTTTARQDGVAAQSRRHKHKVKHKKKRKEDRKHKVDENVEPNVDQDKGRTTSTNSKIASGNKKIATCVNDSLPKDALETIPNNSTDNQNELQNTRHKLSISIKRVNNANYVTCDPNNQSGTDEIIPPNSPKSGLIHDHNGPHASPYTEENSNYLNATPDTDSGSDQCHSCDEVSGDTPNFPFLALGELDEDEATRLFMTLEWNDVDSCRVSDCLYKVGDIVWGKVNSHPWWPAKIINLKMLPHDNPTQLSVNQAQVSWYGSSTLTLLPMEGLQHFLNQFNIRYRRHGEAAYQKAVNEAKEDVKLVLGEQDHNLGSGVAPENSPITASPREVDVLS